MGSRKFEVSECRLIDENKVIVASIAFVSIMAIQLFVVVALYYNAVVLGSMGAVMKAIAITLMSFNLVLATIVITTMVIIGVAVSKVVE